MIFIIHTGMHMDVFQVLLYFRGFSTLATDKFLIQTIIRFKPSNYQIELINVIDLLRINVSQRQLQSTGVSISVQKC